MLSTKMLIYFPKYQVVSTNIVKRKFKKRLSETWPSCGNCLVMFTSPNKNLRPGNLLSLGPPENRLVSSSKSQKIHYLTLIRN